MNSNTARIRAILKETYSATQHVDLTENMCFHITGDNILEIERIRLIDQCRRTRDELENLTDVAERVLFKLVFGTPAKFKPKKKTR